MAEMLEVWAHFMRPTETEAICNTCKTVVATKWGKTCNIVKHLQIKKRRNLKQCGLFDVSNVTSSVQRRCTHRLVLKINFYLLTDSTLHSIF